MICVYVALLVPPGVSSLRALAKSRGKCFQQEEIKSVNKIQLRAQAEHCELKQSGDGL